MSEFLSVAIFKLLVASASGSTAIEAHAHLTLFKLCLPLDVIILTLIVIIFGFVSGAEVFNFDVLLFCLLPNKDNFFQLERYLVKQGYDCILLIALHKVLFFAKMYRLVCQHYLDNSHMSRKSL